LALTTSKEDGLLSPLLYGPGALMEEDLEEAVALTQTKPRLINSHFGSPVLVLRDSPDAVQGGFETAFMVDLDDLRENGLVSMIDMGTLGLLMGLRRRGMEPGRDFKLYTHSNSSSSILLGWSDEIVRIEYDTPEIGSLLFEVLDGQAIGQPPPRTMLAASEVGHPEPDWVLPGTPRVRRPGQGNLDENFLRNCSETAVPLV
jgi:hypothetical protein